MTGFRVDGKAGDRKAWGYWQDNQLDAWHLRAHREALVKSWCPVTVDAALLGRMEDALKAAHIPYTGAMLSGNYAGVRFSDTDTQLRAKHVIDEALNPDPSNPGYVVALNLVSASPAWLTAIHAYPMYLGLDLRGGVGDQRAERAAGSQGNEEAVGGLADQERRCDLRPLQQHR